MSSGGNSENNEKNIMNLKKQLNDVKKDIESVGEEERHTSEFRRQLFSHNMGGSLRD